MCMYYGNPFNSLIPTHKLFLIRSLKQYAQGLSALELLSNEEVSQLTFNALLLAPTITFLFGKASKDADVLFLRIKMLVGLKVYIAQRHVCYLWTNVAYLRFRELSK